MLRGSPFLLTILLVAGCSTSQSASSDAQARRAEAERRDALVATVTTVTLNPAQLQGCTSKGVVSANADRATSIQIHADWEVANHNLNVALYRNRTESYKTIPPYTEPDWTSTLKLHAAEIGGNALLKSGDPLTGEAYFCSGAPQPTPAPN